MKDKIQKIIGNDAVDTEDMIFVVQQHIKEVKGVDVNFSPANIPIPRDHPFFQMVYGQQCQLLSETYIISESYFVEKYAEE